MYEMTLADCLFMKKHRFLFLASLMALVLLGGMAVVACSNNFKHVPRTGFVTHQVKIATPISRLMPTGMLMIKNLE